MARPKPIDLGAVKELREAGHTLDGAETDEG